MAQRPIYRQVYLDYEGTQNYMKFFPDGTSLTLAFTMDDEYGDGVNIYKANRLNRIDTDIHKKNWFACTKKEWNEAVQRAQAIMKGIPLPWDG